MSVKLEGDPSFKISREVQESRVLPSEGYVEWSWFVTPQKSGAHILKLYAMALIYIPPFEKKYEYPVYNRTIVVEVDQIRNIENYLLSGSNWIGGLIVSALIVGIVGLVVDRIRAKRTR